MSAPADYEVEHRPHGVLVRDVARGASAWATDSAVWVTEAGERFLAWSAAPGLFDDPEAEARRALRQAEELAAFFPD